MRVSNQKLESGKSWRHSSYKHDQLRVLQAMKNWLVTFIDIHFEMYSQGHFTVPSLLLMCRREGTVTKKELTENDFTLLQVESESHLSQCLVRSIVASSGLGSCPRKGCLWYLLFTCLAPTSQPLSPLWQPVPSKWLLSVIKDSVVAYFLIYHTTLNITPYQCVDALKNSLITFLW